MPDELTLRPATRDELREAFGYALRFGRRGKPHRHALEDMARIAADVLIEHLELSGYVILKRPPAVAHTGRSAHEPGDG